MAAISLLCGLRAGEIFGLTWADIDLVRASLHLRDTKAGDSRTVPLTELAKNVFARRLKAEKDAREKAERKGVERPPKELVFTGRGGVKITSISATFDRAVDALKLNVGITDRRQRLTFHSLRHTCASFLVQSGVPLYTVSRILGHKTMRMTERYSHLAQDDLRHALGNVDAALKATEKQTGEGGA
jgi:integrase